MTTTGDQSQPGTGQGTPSGVIPSGEPGAAGVGAPSLSTDVLEAIRQSQRETLQAIQRDINGLKSGFDRNMHQLREHVDERLTSAAPSHDKDILAMVGPDFASQERVTLHHGDALTFPLPSRLTWDYAWHDLFCKEGHLQILHARVLLRYQDVCRHQGAWGFPRCFKRTWDSALVGGPRKRRQQGV